MKIREKQGSGLNKKFAHLALWTFVIVSAAIVLLQSFKFDYGLREDMTISKYVGLSYWSAGVFLVANIVIAWAWVKYAEEVRREMGMSRMWHVLTVTGAVMLVMLSSCPMGLFDDVQGKLGLVSRLHQFSSSSMFVLMMMTDLGMFLRVRDGYFRVYSAIYLAYGVTMALFFVIQNEWFWGHTLGLESLFLLGYLVLLCIIPGKTDKRSLGVV